MACKLRSRSSWDEFHEAALTIYYGLKELGVKMDLSDLVEPGGSMDDERFRLHSRPNKAATGLNYVRLMKRPSPIS